MPDRSRLTRRHFLRLALVGTSLSIGAALAACQQPPVASPPGEQSRSSAPTPVPARSTAGGTAIPTIAPLPGADPGNPAISHLAVIVVDGMMPRYLGLGSYPNLEGLIRGGTSFRRAWVGHVVNDTPTGHVALVSGKLPRNTGVIYFYWRDPSTNRIQRIISEQMLEGSAFATLMRERSVPSLSRTIRQHRPGARVVALGSTKDFAAVAMGLDAADYVAYASRISTKQDGDEIAADGRLVAPSGNVEPGKGASGGQATSKTAEVSPPVRKLVPGGPTWARLPDDLLRDPAYAMTTREVGDNDEFAGSLAVGVVQKLRPEVLLLNLPDNDQIGHLTGGSTSNPAAVARTMAVADAQVGRLIEAYRRAGLFERTLWVVTSDHGMTPNGLNIHPDYVKRALDDVDLKLLAGDAVHYWLRNPGEAARAATALERQPPPGLLGVYFKVDQGNGRFLYQPSKGLEARLDARQQAALGWLQETFAGPESPDLTLVLAENVHLHTAPTNTIGAHSEAGWLLQDIPLVFSGPGVPGGQVAGYPARLIDVAPTVLALMGLPAEGMDGVVLAEALAASSPAERDAQLQSPETQRLLRHQDALAELSRRSSPALPVIPSR